MHFNTSQYTYYIVQYIGIFLSLDWSNKHQIIVILFHISTVNNISMDARVKECANN